MYQQESSEQVTISNVQVTPAPEVQQQNVEENTSYTYSEVRAPVLTPAAPSILVSTNLAQDLVGEGHTTSSARIVSTSQEAVIADAGYLSEEARLDEERKQQELAKIQQKNVEEVEKQTEKYRKEQEAKAEKIRKELEEQHAKDIEFRQKLVQQAVDTQKAQIDTEAKFAKKELERERTLAQNALDKSKISTVTEVSLDTAAGTAVSGNTVVSEKVSVTAENTDAPKSLGDKVKEFLFGK